MTDDIDLDDSADTAAAYRTSSAPDSVGMRALAGLFLLEHEFRRAPGHAHLARLIVNRLNRFAPYDCAIFWTGNAKGRVYDVTISGIVKSRETKATLDWGARLGKWLNKSGYANTPLTAAMVEMEKTMTDWPANLPKNGLYVALRTQSGQLRGGIVLLRAQSWSQPVRVMLDQLAEAAAYTVEAIDRGVHGRKAARRGFGKWLAALIIVALLGASFLIPVPVNVNVPARLAVAQGEANVPRGPAQIDMQIPPQGAMALKPGSRLKTNYQGTDYLLEVEHISPWMAGLFADRQIRARVVSAPDGLAPPALQNITIENAAMPLPLYILRGPIASMRKAFKLD